MRSRVGVVGQGLGVHGVKGWGGRGQGDGGVKGWGGQGVVGVKEVVGSRGKGDGRWWGSRGGVVRSRGGRVLGGGGHGGNLVVVA